MGLPITLQEGRLPPHSSSTVTPQLVSSTDRPKGNMAENTEVRLIGYHAVMCGAEHGLEV